MQRSCFALDQVADIAWLCDKLSSLINIFGPFEGPWLKNAKSGSILQKHAKDLSKALAFSSDVISTPRGRPPPE